MSEELPSFILKLIFLNIKDKITIINFLSCSKKVKSEILSFEECAKKLLKIKYLSERENIYYKTYSNLIKNLEKRSYSLKLQIEYEKTLIKEEEYIKIYDQHCTKAQLLQGIYVRPEDNNVIAITADNEHMFIAGAIENLVEIQRMFEDDSLDEFIFSEGFFRFGISRHVANLKDLFQKQEKDENISLRTLIMKEFNDIIISKLN